MGKNKPLFALIRYTASSAIEQKMKNRVILFR